jgi:hypothetical protein
MARFKVKAYVDGTARDVELDDAELPDALVLKANLDDHIEPVLSRRMKNAKKNALDEALKDETFRNEALKAWNIDPAKLAAGDKAEGEKLEAAKAGWAKAELEPVKQRAETAEGRLQKMLDRMRDTRIVEAARKAGVREEYLESFGDGTPPMIVPAVRDRYKHDEEADDFFALDETGKEFAYSRNPKKGRPHMGIEEHFETIREDKRFAKFFDDKRPRGPGLGTGTGGGGSGQRDVYLSPADARNAQAYRAAEETAKKQGGRVLVAES